MIQQTYSEIVTKELLRGAIENREFTGFLQDYHVLHCLIRKHLPKSFFEIGTNFGTGTKIITNAMGNFHYLEYTVYSLDLPFGQGDAPLYAKGKDHTGINCNLPFIQLRGDSMTFDYSQFPCEGYFIDGNHEYDNVFHETTEILKCKPKIIIYHDLHVVPVQQAIEDAFKDNWSYNLYRVNGTRIAYAIRKELTERPALNILISDELNKKFKGQWTIDKEF